MKYFRHAEGTANTLGTCGPATQTPYRLTNATPFPVAFLPLPPSSDLHLGFDAYSTREWPLAFTRMCRFLNDG